MSIYVKDPADSTWKLAKEVWVNNSGSWIEPQEVWINNGGTWVLSHKVVYITSNQANLNLYNYIGSPSSALRLKVYINPGVTVYSSDPTVPSLTIGSFPANSQVLLINNGTIKGAGGKGGIGANYNGTATAGQQGGTAIYNGTAGYIGLSIDNTSGAIYGGGGGGGGGGYHSTSSTCFPAGTLISTPNGLVAIETLTVGDLVYGFDIYTDPVHLEFDAELVAKPITETFKHSWAEADEFSRLLVINHTKGTLTITGNHEVLSITKVGTGPYTHFVRAEHLEVGDIIYDDQGQQVEVLEITPGDPYDYVYNFEVADVHTYVASGIRVHNGGGGGGGKGTTTTTYAGGGGGGGAGQVVGAGGTGGTGADNNGSTGSAGTTTAGGAGAANDGANGGGLGSAGAAGGQTNPGAGGAAGYYIYGNTGITWVATGTVAGLVG